MCAPAAPVPALGRPGMGEVGVSSARPLSGESELSGEVGAAGAIHTSAGRGGLRKKSWRVESTGETEEGAIVGGGGRKRMSHLRLRN